MVANALSQRLRHLNDIDLKDKDIDDQILAKLRTYKICLIVVDDSDKELREEDLKLQNRRLIL